jgi:hypothetical protein
MPIQYDKEEKKRLKSFLEINEKRKALVKTLQDAMDASDEKLKAEAKRAQDMMAIRAEQRGQNQAEVKGSLYIAEEAVIEADEAFVRVALRDGELKLTRQAFQVANYSNLLKIRLSTGGFFVDMKKTDFTIIHDYIAE